LVKELYSIYEIEAKPHQNLYQEFLHISKEDSNSFLNKVYQAISDKQGFEVIQKSFYQVRTLNGCTRYC
jgi:hypothetical protein